jgi:hypothetical protein
MNTKAVIKKLVLKCLMDISIEKMLIIFPGKKIKKAPELLQVLFYYLE